MKTLMIKYMLPLITVMGFSVVLGAATIFTNFSIDDQVITKAAIQGDGIAVNPFADIRLVRINPVGRDNTKPVHQPATVLLLGVVLAVIGGVRFRRKT